MVVIDAATVTSHDWTLPSQKAMGLLHCELGRLWFALGDNVPVATPNGTVPAASTDPRCWVRLPDALNDPDSLRVWFARPCPIVPRHGVYESRQVMARDLVAVTAELLDAMEAHNDWPIVAICEFVPALANGVLFLSPGSQAGYGVYGTGHDGVTGAKSPTVGWRTVFSHVRTTPSEYQGEPLEVEGVANTTHACITQYRRMTDAPVDHDAPYYLPYSPYRVNHVYRFRSETREDFIGDYGLLELEKFVKSAPPGTIVLHEGGNLLSHAAAHCICAGVAYTVLPEQARVGNVLTAGDAPPPPPVEQFTDQLERGLERALYHTLRVPAFRLSILFHKWMAGQRNDLTAFAAGFYVGELVRRGVAASLGECRHLWHHTYGGRTRAVVRRVMLDYLPSTTSRCTIYDRVLRGGTTLDTLCCHAALAAHVFAELQWGASYGGTAWLRSTILVLQCIFALRDADWKTALSLANRIENAVHNNGRYLSKFDMEELNIGSGEVTPSFKWSLMCMATLSALEQPEAYEDIVSVPQEPVILRFVEQHRDQYQGGDT